MQLYTSGTTGKPKGVPVPLSCLAAFQTYLHYSVDAILAAGYRIGPFVHFEDSLPKAPSGTIQRFVLRGEARK